MGAPDDTTLAKSVAMCVLFAASMSLGTLPILLSKILKWNSKSDSKDNTYVQLLLCTGGGVLLCTTFLHLLPEVSDKIHELKYIPQDEIHYAELLMCVGFFTMYLVEECVHAYIHHRQKHSNNILTRTLSIRRGDSKSEIRELSGDNSSTSASDQSVRICTDSVNGHGNNNHNHSHFVDDNNSDTTVKTLRGLLVVLALSVHELFEGLAIGLESSNKNVWYMFGAVSAHKLVIAFCIGVELVTSQMTPVIVTIYVFTFAVVSPMGIGAGIFLSRKGDDSSELPSVFLQGLASGTLLYVVFFEILSSDRKSGLKQFFAVLVGFLIMLGITFLE